MERTPEQKQAAIRIRELIKACWKSKKCKEAFIAAPVKTLEKVTGKKSNLPKGFRIVVEDRSDPDIIYPNIPSKPKYSSYRRFPMDHILRPSFQILRELFNQNSGFQLPFEWV